MFSGFFFLAGKITSTLACNITVWPNVSFNFKIHLNFVVVRCSKFPFEHVLTFECGTDSEHDVKKFFIVKYSFGECSRGNWKADYYSKLSGWGLCFFFFIFCFVFCTVLRVWHLMDGGKGDVYTFGRRLTIFEPFYCDYSPIQKMTEILSLVTVSIVISEKEKKTLCVFDYHNFFISRDKTKKNACY